MKQTLLNLKMPVGRPLGGKNRSEWRKHTVLTARDGRRYAADAKGVLTALDRPDMRFRTVRLIRRSIARLLRSGEFDADTAAGIRRRIRRDRLAKRNPETA